MEKMPRLVDDENEEESYCKCGDEGEELDTTLTL